MLEFKFDTQLLIEGQNLSEDGINEYITSHFEGDCLLAVGDEDLVKIHFHTNEPWKVSNTARRWATFTMWLLKTWSARRTAFRGERTFAPS